MGTADRRRLDLNGAAGKGIHAPCLLVAAVAFESRTPMLRYLDRKGEDRVLLVPGIMLEEFAYEHATMEASIAHVRSVLRLAEARLDAANLQITG